MDALLLTPLVSHLILWPLVGLILGAGWLFERRAQRLRDRDEAEERIRRLAH